MRGGRPNSLGRSHATTSCYPIRSNQSTRTSGDKGVRDGVAKTSVKEEKVGQRLTDAPSSPGPVRP